ncbi:2-oxoglutarate dehydrogenase E2 component (dihydrolipoamide succinyltransferase) [Kibdelosporangium banguiense]|uniref:Dihydrolipoamide acetyltransferase component of pyruvate dehydrogenase complex n=1 Tax=Kibdelosporangium banguiense TaxID=1365924 RepID=A0ABS4TN26_9PSEU|nr:2-oxo acid dehydrogenase subunit E2 [Kibdelosporangium banguiense]MBP2325816.1 2-oxoglutarate dehydrogenase E2 component (dihydrolipoamide succinyltransferase) [Kibdelosporangium banguiense]
MTEVRVPKLNNNDTEYILTEWIVADGEQVEPGRPVATLETSKAAEELLSPQAGVLRHLVEPGAECSPGQVIAQLLPEGAEVTPIVAGQRPQSGPIITEPAAALIRELCVSPQEVQALGLKVVRRNDIEQLGGLVRTLSPVQRAISRTVTRSHQTIPAAYTVIKVDVSAAMREARETTRQLRMLVGLPDLLVSAVAKLHKDFPLFFATLQDERTIRLADTPQVGVTVDLGDGLHIPVIRGNPAVPEIARQMAAFRTSAQHGTFRQEDLLGANIVVTLHHDEGIMLAIPIIHPGNVCALALGAPDNGVAHIGLAYDHRVVNGRDAVVFLQSLRDLLAP